MGLLSGIGVTEETVFTVKNVIGRKKVYYEVVINGVKYYRNDSRTLDALVKIQETEKQMDNNQKFKVGDLVKIKNQENLEEMQHKRENYTFTLNKRYEVLDVHNDGDPVIISDNGIKNWWRKKRFVLANDEQCDKTCDLSDISELLDFLNISQKAQDKLLGMIDEKFNQEQQEWQSKIEDAREQARREVKNQLLSTLSD